MDTPTCKLYTVEEANALVPLLQEHLDTLQKRVKDIVRLKRQLEVLSLICGAKLSHDTPDFVEFTDKTSHYHQMIGEADGIIREIRAKKAESPSSVTVYHYVRFTTRPLIEITSA